MRLLRPLRCMIGRHTGQENGGTMKFTCPRCGGSFWQPADFRATTALADRMIEGGQADEALEMAQQTIRDHYRKQT